MELAISSSERAFPNIETETAWCIKRSEFTMASYYNLKSKLSTLDFKQKEVPVAFFEHNVENIPYVIIPKISRGLLESIMGRRIIFTKDIPEAKKATFKKPPLKPMKHQEPLLTKAVDVWNNENTENRIVLSLAPGLGKTFCSAYLIWKMSVKFMFVVYSGKLITQTYQSFGAYLGYEGIYLLERGSDFLELDYKKIKGLLLTHSMLRSLIKNYGLDYVVDVLENKIGISMSIYDEFDREVSSLYKLDCFTNFKYSLRLTGTPFKSLKPDDRIFQYVYKGVNTLGGDVHIGANKTLHLISYKFSPSKKEYMKMKLFDEALFKTYYNDYLARKDILLDYIMKNFYKEEDSLMKKLLKEDGIIVFYCGRIENCNIVKEKLIKNFGIDENDIGIYNSSINDKNKEIAETKPFIMSTCQSLGRGYDNKNIRLLVYLEFSFSISEAEQTYSRTGRLNAPPGHVIQGLDYSFGKVLVNHEKRERLGIYSKHFTSVNKYKVPDNHYQFYVSGYRQGSPEANEILKYNQQKIQKTKLSKR